MSCMYMLPLPEFLGQAYSPCMESINLTDQQLSNVHYDYMCMSVHKKA